MKTETVNYRADGLDMVGVLHLPEGAPGPRPGVLVFPHIFGPGRLSRKKAERLAEELGYVAMDCDIFGGRRHTDSMEEAQSLAKPFREGDVEHVRARTVEAFKAFAARPEVDASRIAAIGFCSGGTMAYELAMSGVDLKAAIGFHSGLKVKAPGDAKNIKGKVLTMIGEDDPSVPPETRAPFVKMLGEAGVDFTFTTYGGVVHSFTDENAAEHDKPQALRYDAAADRRSWAQMADLLEEVFG